jgi:hypothetical protein
MAELFELEDLAGLLREGDEFDEAAATVARRVVSGWLRNSTQLTTWPDPVPDDLYGWAIELTAMFYGNPTALASEAIDDYRATMDRARRADILAAAQAAYSGAAQPQYEFPEPDWHWSSVESTCLE